MQIFLISFPKLAAELVPASLLCDFCSFEGKKEKFSLVGSGCGCCVGGRQAVMWGLAVADLRGRTVG